MAVHRPLSITDIWPCSGTSSLYSFNKYSLFIYLVPGTALSPGYITMNETEEKKNPSFCSPNIPREGLPQGLCTCCSISHATYFSLHLASLLITHQVLVKHLCSGKPPLCPWVKSSPRLSSPLHLSVETLLTLMPYGGRSRKVQWLEHRFWHHRLPGYKSWPLTEKQCDLTQVI